MAKTQIQSIQAFCGFAALAVVVHDAALSACLSNDPRYGFFDGV